MEGRIVIRNAVVQPAGARATVVVASRRVADVAPRGRAVESCPGDWEVDADGRLVVAGLVDGHTHLALGGLLRLAGLPGSSPLAASDLLRDPLERRATPEIVEPLVRASALAAMKAGVTCAFDVVCGAPGAAEAFLAAEARALDGLGLRAAVAYAAGGPEDVLTAAAFAQRHSADRRLRGMIGLSGLADAADDAIAAAAEHAPRAGLHVSVGEDEADLARAFERWGMRPVEILAARGLLSPRSIVAHAAAVHSEGVALAESGAYLAVAPRAAMFWGAPPPALQPGAAVTVPVVFGTDGLFSDVAGEAFAATMSRHARGSAGASSGFVGRIAWPAAARLASTTFGETLGVLEPGAVADLVVLDWRPAVPLPNVPDGDLALLWAGAPAAWVIVDGEVRIREGRLLGGNEAEIADRAREAAAALLR